MVQLILQTVQWNYHACCLNQAFSQSTVTNKHSIVLQDAHIPQEAKDGLSFILEEEYNSIISKLPTDVGRPNLLQMDILTVGPLIACKSYPIPLKYQKFVKEEIKLIENAGSMSKS